MPADGPDVLIVGGGAAGCVLARRLSDDGSRRVLLLEAGPELAPADTPPAYLDGWDNPSGGAWTTDWGFRSEPDAAGNDAPLRRGRLLGGTSWLTRFAVRGPASDYDEWAARGNPGWAYRHVLPSFRRLEADAEYGDRPAHGRFGPIPINRYPDAPRSPIHLATVEAFDALGFPAIADLNAPDAVGVGPMPMSTRAGVRVTTLSAYLPPAARPPNLSIRTSAQVAGLRVRSGRVVGVRLLGGEPIDAGLVILAAGTYASPAVLLRSGIGPAGELRALGIPVAADLPGVGRNLADHPGVDLDSGWQGEAPTGGPILHSLATFRSVGRAADASPDLTFWLTDPNGPEPSFYLDPILLKPESRGTVTLRSADPTAAPRIALPALSSGRDVDRLAEGVRIATEIAARLSQRGLTAGPPAPITPGADLRRRVLDGAYSLPHVVGTCRMGPSPDDGDVVDAAGRVHGIDGLMVADASVIPEPPAGFPHVITIMVAEHLAAPLAAPMAESPSAAEDTPLP